MEMVELYKVLADGTKLIVVEDRFKTLYLQEPPIYQGNVYSIPVDIINRRINFMKPLVIDGEGYIFCEVD